MIMCVFEYYPDLNSGSLLLGLSVKETWCLWTESEQVSVDRPSTVILSVSGNLLSGSDMLSLPVGLTWLYKKIARCVCVSVNVSVC